MSGFTKFTFTYILRIIAQSIGSAISSSCCGGLNGLSLPFYSIPEKHIVDVLLIQAFPRRLLLLLSCSPI